MAGMRVIFVEPNFPKNQREFVRGLAEVGAEVIGIGESPQEHLDDELQGLDAALPPGAAASSTSAR